MPHDAVTIRQDVLLKDTKGGNDRVVLTQYEAPAVGDAAGNVTIGEDTRKEYDLWAARQAMDV